MADKLSGIAIIICIAFGSLTFILLFIFAKRQITRFALKSRRGPHVSVGIDAPKQLHQEIERRLDTIEKIRCDPWLLNESNKSIFDNFDQIEHLYPSHLYRMKVVDDFKELRNLSSSNQPTKSYHVEDNVTLFFLKLHKNGHLHNLDTDTLYKFLSCYEHARYQPKEFLYEDYCQYLELLKIVKKHLLGSSSKSDDELYISEDYTLKEEAQPDESVKPLLTTSLPCLNIKSSQNFTHETSV